MKINCDQVALIGEILNRYHQAMTAADAMPRVSRLRHAARLSGLLELMELLGLEAEDFKAKHNAFIGLELVMHGEAPDNWGKNTCQTN